MSQRQSKRPTAATWLNRRVIFKKTPFMVFRRSNKTDLWAWLNFRKSFMFLFVCSVFTTAAKFFIQKSSRDVDTLFVQEKSKTKWQLGGATERPTWTKYSGSITRSNSKQRGHGSSYYVRNFTRAETSFDINS